MTPERKRTLTFIAILGAVILVGLLVLSRCLPERQAQPTEAPAFRADGPLGTDTPTTNPTTTIPAANVDDSEIWLFTEFTGEVRKSGGYEYEYAIFINETSGRKLRTWCSAPNSPAPVANTESAKYKWDKNNNILYPVNPLDPKTGKQLQTFWEPEYVN